MELDILIVLFAELHLVMKNAVIKGLKCAMCPQMCTTEWEHSPSGGLKQKTGAEETSELVKTKLKHFSSSRLSPEELLC